MQDSHWDALDSLIAAAATLTALQDIESGWKITAKNIVEGWVYV